MTYALNWLVPDRILYVTVYRDTPIRDWGAIQMEIVRQLESVPSPAHVIIDTEPKINLNDVNDFRALSGLKPIQSMNLFRLVIIQDNIMVRFFSALAIQVFAPSIPYDTKQNFDEAIATLQSYDPSLKQLTFEKPDYVLRR